MPIISGSTIIRGSKGTPIAQDDDDNLIAVMKGNYEGALKTWKVDEDGRGEMFINDLTDDWGNKNIIGLAELATRLDAKQQFDNRGRQIWTDGFEEATLKWNLQFIAGGSIVRSTASAWKGNASALLTTVKAFNTSATMNRYFYNPLTGQYGVEVAWSQPKLGIPSFYMSLLVYDGTRLSKGYVGFRSTGEYYYMSSAGVFVSLGHPVCQLADIHFWHKMKLVIDITSKEYVRILVDGHEFDMTGTGLRVTNSVECPRILTSLQLIGNDVTTFSMHVDDFIFSHLEP